MAWNRKNMHKIKVYMNIPNDNGEMVLYGPGEIDKARKASTKLINAIVQDCVNYAYANYMAMDAAEKEKLKSAT